ncbi:MAG TPA: outer membrane protein assembly factor BamD [Casimicrobiaceae bacterium]|jgi:outer membrane protein assembly factor BamD
MMRLHGGGWRGWVAGALVALLVSGCNLLPEVREETSGWSPERLYSSAHDAMLEGNYTRAIKLFETLEARYPYGRFAQQAILEGAFSNWRAQEPAAATAACDRFIRTFPNHPNVDYAYFLKGLVYFREDQGLFGYVYELDLAERDPKQMRESFAAFKELVARFPDSRYADDAKLRMRYLSNAIGQYEVNVARYYYNRGAYVAAASRAQASIVNTPQTASNEEALDLLMKSYEKLGLQQLSDDARTVLAKSFPDSRYVNPAPPKPWWKFW